MVMLTATIMSPDMTSLYSIFLILILIQLNAEGVLDILYKPTPHMKPIRLVCPLKGVPDGGEAIHHFQGGSGNGNCRFHNAGPELIINFDC